MLSDSPKLEQIYVILYVFQSSPIAPIHIMNDLITNFNRQHFIERFGQELGGLGKDESYGKDQSILNYVDGLSEYDEYLGGFRFENTRCSHFAFAHEKGLFLLLMGESDDSVKTNIWYSEIDSVVAYHNQKIQIPKKNALVNVLKTGIGGLFWSGVGSLSEAIIKRVKPCESKEIIGSIYEIRIKSNEGRMITLRLSTAKEHKHPVSKFFDKYLKTSLTTKDDRRTTCYIATVCYSNPNSNKVIAFRRYRDTVLKRYWLGRKFIDLYYKYSPLISEKLYGKSYLRASIRLVLDAIYRLIKK